MQGDLRLRLFFLLIFDGISKSGVIKKIFSQIKSLNDAGIDANLILIGDQSNLNINSSNIIQIPIADLKTGNIINKIIRTRKIANIIGNQIQDLKPVDFVYIRYPILIPFCPLIFFKPFRKCKVIFEYNSIYRKEFLIGHNYLYLVLEFFWGNLIRYQADGGIAVTHELMNQQRKKIYNRNKPFITIANGIEVDSVPLRTPPNFIKDRLFTMICVANFSKWHGLDRLILGITKYSGKYFVKLHIVGEGPEIVNLKNLCEENNIIDQVIFHGYLSGPNLDRLFDESHLAVGEMGIHRNKMSEASTLKAREYCSRGIPFTIEGSDPDFPNDFAYVMRIPMNENPIEIDEVIMFASRVCNDLDHPRKMRDYAFEHLDWSIKMKKLKTYLEDMVQ